MKYIKNFSKHSLYEAYLVGSEFPETEGKPTVQFCKLENEVHYNKYIPLPHYNVLDILYANAAGEKKVDSAILDTSLGYTPIGICVAKTGFFGENEPARFMSLKYMNCDTPETGSLTAQSIHWSDNNPDIPTIDNIQVTYNGGSNWGYLTTPWQTKTSNLIPSVFDANNEWNTSVLGTVNQYVVTDIDGKNKTNKILATATSQSTWMTDTSIINSRNAGYTPAACCCARYHTIGTEAGDWYLGAAGEMSMIATLRDDINNKLAQIAAVYSTDSISALTGDDYNDYWSSTEYSSSYAYYLSIDYGYPYCTSKSNKYCVIAMLAY